MSKLKCNTFILPTEDKTNLTLGISMDWNIPGQMRGTNFHLYFLSNRQAKDNDWIIPKCEPRLPWQFSTTPKPIPYWCGLKETYWKIEATTDKSIGIPIIDEIIQLIYCERKETMTEILIEMGSAIRCQSDQAYEDDFIILDEQKIKTIHHEDEYDLEQHMSEFPILHEDGTVFCSDVRNEWNREDLKQVIHKIILESKRLWKYEGPDKAKFTLDFVNECYEKFLI